jgi:hypothetical protein
MARRRSKEARNAAIAAIKKACEKSDLSAEEKARVMAYLDRIARERDEADDGAT